MSCLRYLCLFAHVVSNTYRVLFLFSFSSSRVPYVSSLDCSFLIAFWVFSNVCLFRISPYGKTWQLIYSGKTYNNYIYANIFPLITVTTCPFDIELDNLFNFSKVILIVYNLAYIFRY